MSCMMTSLVRVLVVEGLQKRGISVWVDEVGLKAGVDFLSKIGQAIIDAKVSCLLAPRLM